jgi:O-antigen ligase
VRLRPATTGVPAVLGDLPVGDHRVRRFVVHGFAWIVVALTLVALAIGLAVLLGRNPPGSTVLFLFGAGVLGSLALAAARYDALVAVAVLLLAVVRVEPAPSDFLFVVAIAVASVTGRLHGLRIPPSVLWLTTFFVALNLLSAVEVIDAARATFYLAITIYLLVFALWVSTYVDSRRRAQLVGAMYVTAAAVSAFVASLALVVAFPGHELFLFGSERAQGLFKDPLVYAPFLVPPALIVAEQAVSPGCSRVGRLLRGAIFLTLVVGVLLSFSRAAWLNLAVGLFVLAAVLVVRQGAGRRILALSAIVLVAGVAALGTLRVTGSEELLVQRTHLQRYDEERFGAQLFGLEQSTRYPLGIGPGQFEVLSPVSAHSLYVRALAEQGLFGLLTLLALLLVTLAFAARNAAAGRDTFGIGSAALLAAWCGLMANSLFVDTLHWRHLWLVAALIWAGSTLSGRPLPSDRA